MDLLSTLIALLGVTVLVAALINPLRPLDSGRVERNTATPPEPSTE